MPAFEARVGCSSPGCGFRHLQDPEGTLQPAVFIPSGDTPGTPPSQERLRWFLSLISLEGRFQGNKVVEHRVGQGLRLQGRWLCARV